MNYLYIQTLMLIVTFCTTALIIVSSENYTLVNAVICSHLTVEIVYLATVFILMGVFFFKRNLSKTYTKMQEAEDNLLRKKGESVIVRLTNKQIKEAQKINEQAKNRQEDKNKNGNNQSK